MSSESPKARIYSIGSCYLCQICLHCNKNCSYSSCKCNKEKRQKTPLYKKGKKRKCYSRIFQPNGKKFNFQQVKELKYMSNYYGYNIDFSAEVKFSLCNGCNGKLYRLGKQKNTQDKLKKAQVDDNSASELASRHLY